MRKAKRVFYHFHTHKQDGNKITHTDGAIGPISQINTLEDYRKLKDKITEGEENTVLASLTIVGYEK